MPGGVHEVIRKLGEGLTKRGHDVMVFQFNPQGKPSKDIVAGFRIIRVSTLDFYGFSIKALKLLLKIVQDWNPDIVHIHGYHTLFSPVAIIKIKKTSPNLPLVFSPHYMPHGHNTMLGKLGWPLYNKLNNRILPTNVDQIVVASKFELNSFLNDIPSSRGLRITIIPHGVDKMTRIPSLKHHNNRVINLLFAGYLHERKGVHFIILAMHELVYNMGMRNIHLTIIGEGEYKKRLMRLASSLKLEKFITWKSFTSTKRELLDEIKRSDLLVLLSKNENYGIIVAESLALGTPVIVSDNSALHEFTFEKGCFGVKYPPTPREVALRILQIIEKPNKIGPFTKRIRLWGEVVKDYEKLYQNLVVENEKG